LQLRNYYDAYVKKLMMYLIFGQVCYANMSVNKTCVFFTLSRVAMNKEGLLSRATAMLFPIDWPEPFGLVMIEALACGTPVVAWRRGSVPEVIEDGVTGYVVESVDEAVRAVGEINHPNRADCRRAFGRRFDAERMARDYVDVYARLVNDGGPNR
jgi:glycosyltransferase involved in cell wall biosynthesis